jgi:hypothetical protein
MTLEKVGRVVRIVRPKGNTRFCLLIARNSRGEFYATVPTRYLDSLSFSIEGKTIRMNRKGYIEVVDNQLSLSQAA